MLHYDDLQRSWGITSSQGENETQRNAKAGEEWGTDDVSGVPSLKTKQTQLLKQCWAFQQPERSHTKQHESEFGYLKLRGFFFFVCVGWFPEPGFEVLSRA